MAGTPLTGGCQCGQVRYELTGSPLGLYVCHCRECRKQSASAFGISAFFRSADLRLLGGDAQPLVAADEIGVDDRLLLLPELRIAPLGRRQGPGGRDLHQGRLAR